MLFAMCVFYSATLVSVGARATSVSCLGESRAANFVRQSTFSTQPVFAGQKTIRVDESSETVIANISFLSEKNDAAFVSDFSNACAVQSGETKLSISNEAGFNWTFTCKNGVSGEFRLDVPSLGIGNLKIRLSDGQELPLTYSGCKLLN
jgi:hypothetical protein